MGSDVLIGLLNCHSAGSVTGREMMRNLWKLFLEKRGGRVVGCEGRILTIHNKPLIAWLSGADDQFSTRWARCGRLSCILPLWCALPALRAVWLL
jgi:hypothetical protein